MAWKDLFEGFYYLAASFAAVGAGIAALWTLKVYRDNSQLERARWASSLYDKFYDRDTLKQIRNQLDCLPDSDAVNELVITEDSSLPTI